MTSEPSKTVNKVKTTIDAVAQEKPASTNGIKVALPKTATVVNKTVENVNVSGAININTEQTQDKADDGLLDPIDWAYSINDLGNDTYELVYTATMESPWTLYSQFTSDDGPLPTEITYETAGVEKLGKGTESGHKKEGKDKLFDDVEVIKFLPDQPFVIKHKIKAAGVDKIKGYLTYMTCDNERCLPPTDDEFGFDLKSKSFVPYASVG